ncbi:MAG: hybrid sensor histidine kinase/response regulator [Bacteroidota bacterium]
MKDSQTKILVVDDRPEICSLIKSYFKEYNYLIRAVTDPNEAIKAIESGELFHLAILDVILPGPSGFDICRHIRKTYNMYELPVLFLTAKNDIRDKEKGFEAGANDFLTKPFHSKELTLRANSLIKLKELTDSNKVLQDAIEMKNRFFQVSIHDIKNPLTTIIMLAGMMMNESDDDPQKHSQLRLILESGEIISKLVNQILELAKIESGKITFKKELVDLELLTGAVVETYKPKARYKDQMIRINNSLANKLIINADPEKTQQVIDNLISNAVKYTPRAGFIEINFNQEIKNNSRFAIMEIKDNGPGFNEIEMEFIFDKFTKLSAKPTGGETSSGLGLSIARQLTELQDGQIWVESKPGKGSSFFLKFKQEEP